MSDSDSVKRALARLATRSTGTVTRTAAGLSGGRSSEYRAVIDRASAAVQKLSAAAEFVDTVGTQRLRSAIEAAEAAGDHAAERRGERALAAFQRVRSAGAG